MIHTNRVVTVGENESIIDKPIILYRGDREVEIEFELVGNEFMFSKNGNVIETSNASHGQLVLNTPTGEHMFSDIAECHDGKVVFIITKEMIDELIEVGFYSFQIRLFDESQVSRVTLPPILNGFDIRNPIASEDETNIVDLGIVDYSRVGKDEWEEELPTFTWDGAYNKTEWQHHDVIYTNKLNKIEDALYSINANVRESDVVMLNTLNQVKKDADKYVKEHMAEVEADVDEFERNLNTDVQQFKIDTNDAMTAHKNEVDDKLVEGLEDIKNRTTDNYINLKNYSHLVSDNGDWTLALQTAISENSKIVITESIKIYGTVTLHSSKVIEIGACTVSKPSDATDNGPIFWLRGNQNTLRGQGQGSSAITMNVSSPEGAVRIGHSTDTKADTNCLYNQVCDVQISGGSRDDGVSVALMMRNAETDGLASYFHTISNVRIMRAHMGIVLKGYMNANLMNNIQLYTAGGNQTGGGICFLGIGSKVPMENSIHAVFHHGSAHARTIFIDCATFYNKITNILSEQGGTNARCIYISENGQGAFSNNFIYTANVNQANYYYGDSQTRNLFMGTNDIRVSTLNSTSISTNTITTQKINQTIKKTSTYRNINNYAEGATVNLLSVANGGGNNMQGVMGTIKLYIRASTNVPSFLKLGEQKFTIKQSSNSTPSVEVLSEIGHKMTWSDLTLTTKCGNNGTNTTTQEVRFELELFGHSGWQNLTIDENFTEI